MVWPRGQKSPPRSQVFINHRARHFGMRKSISKLIIAGMALALAVPVGANAQQKAKGRHTETTTVNSVAQPLPAGKHLQLPEGLRTARTLVDKGSRYLAKPGHVTRPMNFKLNRPSAPLHVTASEPLNGVVIFGDDWSNEYTPYGVYSIPTDGATNEVSEIALVPEMAGVMSGVVVGDRYYTSTLETFWGFILGAYVTVYDIESWEVVEMVDCASDLSPIALSYAYDATSDKVYGEFYKADGSGIVFGEFDPDSFTVTAISEASLQFNVMACAADGTIYVIGMDGNLYTINKENGDMTLIGSTGYASAYYSSGAIDAKTGKLYWNICSDDENGYMAEVDLSTAETTILYQLANNEEIVGMWSPKPAAEDGAPAQVTDFQANFGEGLLNGKLTFKAPTTLFDGSALSGDLTYVIKVNGEEVKTGTVAAGADVEFDYTAAAAGTYKFTAYCANEVGDGPASNIKMYVGVDSPLAPKNVVLTYADDKMTLTWDASDAAHAGYLGEVTYTITRYETGKEPVVVKEGLTECTYTEEFVPDSEALRNVYYTVAANTTEGVSPATASNAIGMGVIIPPYSHSFIGNYDLDGYTIIDANGDGKAWAMTESEGIRMTYNSSIDMDDWFITPSVKLEAGKYYEYSVVVANNSTSYGERVEVKAGKAPEADAMTMEVIPATEVKTGGQNITLLGGIVADEEGDYYVGIHGISDPDQFYLYVREYSISEGASAYAPARPTNVSVTPVQNNYYSATITFTTPDKNILGEDIVTLDWVEVTRDGQVIATINQPKVGTEYSCSDNVDACGTYTYTVVAHDAYGYGLPAEVSAYVGVPIASAPESVTVEATANVGEVNITWDPVTTAYDGADLAASYITYTVINPRMQNEIIAEGLTDCSFTYQAVEEGQAFVWYAVYAVTDGGYSTATASNMIPVGTPYELPFNESFEIGEDGLAHIWGINGNGGEWAIGDNTTFADFFDADASDGYAYMKAAALYGYADLMSGLINLDAEAPALKFAYYNLADDDENEIEVYVTCDGQTDKVAGFTQCDGNAQIGWNTTLVSLKPYAGKTVSITFRAICNKYTYTFIDAISIEQLEDYNLELTSVNGPAKVHPDEDFAITADVLNQGGKAISEYTVELYRNGVLRNVKEGVMLDTGEKATFSFPEVLNITAGEENIYTIKLVCELDPYQMDNDVDYPVILVIPSYPVATDLTASMTNYGVSLTWNEPNTDTEAAPKQAVTDDFESYDAWATDNIGEWTLVDEDGFIIGGVQGADFGPVVAGETACAYFVMNNTAYEANEAYLAHSGHQYLVSTFSYAGEGANADWLISPELSGDAQTVTLYAKSFSSSYKEDFQVLYSTTDKDITSFTEAATYTNIDAEWMPYSVELPAGVKYFAIKCISNDKFMFFVDDVTYTPAAGEAIELSIVGYNVYRNGVKINAEPIEETNYVDANGAETDLYCVTVVYTIGESAPSLTVGVGMTGVNDITGATSVKVAARTIVVTNAQGTVAVYAADGKTVYSEAAAKTNTVTVTPGVYVVKAGETVTKVIVK